jgi:hypothetical protein
VSILRALVAASSAQIRRCKGLTEWAGKSRRPSPPPSLAAQLTITIRELTMRKAVLTHLLVRNG